MSVEFPFLRLDLQRDIVIVPEYARIVNGVKLSPKEFAEHMKITGEWKEGTPIGSRTFNVKFNHDSVDSQ